MAKESAFEKLAGDLHDQIHERSALVNMQGVEIGWAPEDSIPLLAQELEAQYKAGGDAALEEAAKREAGLRKLIEELAQHARHRLGCPKNIFVHHPYATIEGDCNCGLEALLSRAAKERKP